MAINRREFLKLMGCSMAASMLHLPPSGGSLIFPLGVGRVAVSLIYVHEQPSFDSPRAGKRVRDELLTIFEEVTTSDTLYRNKVWYRIANGYVHSGRIQRIYPLPPNPLIKTFPEKGHLSEVTAPYIRSYVYTKNDGWQPLYRLYFKSTHWLVGIDSGPDGSPWYRLRDHYIGAEYFAPAMHLRPIPPEEYEPISTNIPPGDKRIEVSISKQSLTAYEGEKAVLTNTVSTGIHSENLDKKLIPTDTPVGSFHIQLKMPSRHMGDGRLTDNIEDYELPGVPWTSIFHNTGVALHGTYWHNNFGTRMSHGCVNLRNEDALWLFRWTAPIFSGNEYYAKGEGTRVIVTE